MSASPHDIRVQLSSQANVKAQTVLALHNAGPTVLFYSWEVSWYKHKRLNISPFIQATNRRSDLNTHEDRALRFFFCRVAGMNFDCRVFLLNSSGSILPGETKHIPIVFLSSQAGIFTEQWVIRTTPRTEALWHVTLTGSCAAEDLYASERQIIEVVLLLCTDVF
jgi:hypothetical protein